MRILQISLSDLNFNKTAYSMTLYDSISRIGLNFPIQIEKNEHGYQCIDGHKRLSAIMDIIKKNGYSDKFKTIPCMLLTSRSAPPDHLRNHH